MKTLFHLNLILHFQKTLTFGSVSGNYNFQKINEEIEEKLSFLKINNDNFEIETNVTENFFNQRTMGD